MGPCSFLFYENKLTERYLFHLFSQHIIHPSLFNPNTYIYIDIIYICMYIIIYI